MRNKILSHMPSDGRLVPLDVRNLSKPTPAFLALPKHWSVAPKVIQATGALAPRDLKLSDANYLLACAIKHEQLMYRGMSLSNLEEVRTILLSGLQVDKTHETDIYMTDDLLYAVTYAIQPRFGKFSVIVVMPAVGLSSLIEQVTDLEFICNEDIPAKMISEVVVFLEIDGKGAWYRAVLQDEQLVFLPLPEEPMDEIENLPEEMY